MIEEEKAGTLFILDDFKKIASYDNIKKNLQRLTLKGKLEKIIDGIYMKPNFSNTWNMYIPCDIYSLAECIARKNGWDIVPTGEIAVNYFGLSTQLQAKYIYVSSGPYKIYEYDGNKIYFKHTASKKLFKLSKNVQYLIQAINYYGKDKLNEDAYNVLSKSVSENLVDEALNEAIIVEEWIYDSLIKIKEHIEIEKNLKQKQS